MKVDLHVHTRESAGPPQHWLAHLIGVHECYSQPDEVLAEALRKGIDAIAITNHDAAGDALRMAREHPDRVIPGCEYKVYGGSGRYVDVVCLGITERLHDELMRERHRGVERFVAAARGAGIITILAHPAWEVDEDKRGVDPKLLCQWLEVFDLVEGLNANCPAESAVARALAAYFDKTTTGGSDAHDVPSVAMAYTEADAASVGEFLERLRAGQVRPGGTTTNASRFAATSREVLGAFYRRELLRVLRSGSRRSFLAQTSLGEVLRTVAQVAILPGLLWVPQVKTRTYLTTLSGRAARLKTELVDYIALDLAQQLAVEDIPPEERRRRWIEKTGKLMTAFAEV